MRVTREADGIYQRFARLPGSQHIASANAVNALRWAVRRWQPQRVLEIGAGIGTLTTTLLGAQPASAIIATEPDSFCRARLIENLGVDRDRVRLLEHVDQIPTGEEFDLIVLDGGEQLSYEQRLALQGVIFVEGDRAAQRSVMAGTPRNVVAACIRSVRRASTGGSTFPGQVWEGGCWIFKFEPTVSDRARMEAMRAWHSRPVDLRRRMDTRATRRT